MFLGTPITLGQNASVSRQQAASLYSEATVLNDLTPTSTPATNATDPMTGAASGGVRRRRSMLVAGRSVSSDLIEGSRQNVCLRSQEFATSPWTVGGSSVVAADQSTAPDGNTTADSLTFASGADSQVYQSQTLTAATYTVSVYAKTASDTKKFRFKYNNGTTDAYSSDFTATTTWQRFSHSFTGVAAAGNIAISNEAAGGVGSIFVWGAQLELGAFPSSYIPTAGSSVTRGADSLSVSLVSLSGGGLSTTAGTILALAVPDGWTGDQDGTTPWRIAQSLSPSVGNFTLYRTSATNTTVIRVDAGGNQTTAIAHGLTNRTIKKIGATWDAVSVRGTVDGTASGTPDTTLTAPYTAATNMFIGRNSAVAADYFFGWIALLYWPRALTADEIAIISRECGVASTPVL